MASLIKIKTIGSSYSSLSLTEFKAVDVIMPGKPVHANTSTQGD